MPTGLRLLAKAAQFAQIVGNRGLLEVRVLSTLALAYLPTDIVTGQIEHAERPHYETERLRGGIDLLRGGALLQQGQGLPRVLPDHPVADEAVADAGHDSRLPERLGKL